MFSLYTNEDYGVVCAVFIWFRLWLPCSVPMDVDFFREYGCEEKEMRKIQEREGIASSTFLDGHISIKYRLVDFLLDDL